MKLGDKIKLYTLDVGVKYQQRRVKEYLELGKTYTVEKPMVDKYSSNVILQEVPNVAFHTEFFKEYTIDLSVATSQEVFEYVANHLLTQNEVSQDGGACMYRHGNLKCAAGCLISDDEYDEEMEHKQWTKKLEYAMKFPQHLNLIRSLQRVHDSHPVCDWKDRLLKLAIENKLDYAFLQ